MLLRPMFSGGYRIVAGERRWRAARMAGLSEVPAVVREMTDGEEMLFALIENLQREDLSPLEEAKGYQQLIDTQGFTQEEAASAVGKSRPAVANALRLLNLPEDIQQMVERGEISAGHARTLLSFKDEDSMRAAAQKAKEGASVRELEALAKKAGEDQKREAPRSTPANQFYSEAQLAVSDYLGRKVKVAGTKKKGVLQIEFYGEEDLQNLLSDLKLKEQGTRKKGKRVRTENCCPLPLSIQPSYAPISKPGAKSANPTPFNGVKRFEKSGVSKPQR